MMDVLPKVLVKALAQLCEEDILSSWNIGSYNNMTTVSIKFMKPGHIGSTPVAGMGRKSHPHMIRDSEMLKTWKSTLPMSNSSTLEQLAGIEQHNIEVCDKNDSSIDIDQNKNTCE